MDRIRGFLGLLDGSHPVLLDDRLVLQNLLTQEGGVPQLLKGPLCLLWVGGAVSPRSLSPVAVTTAIPASATTVSTANDGWNADIGGTAITVDRTGRPVIARIIAIAIRASVRHPQHRLTPPCSPADRPKLAISSVTIPRRIIASPQSDPTAEYGRDKGLYVAGGEWMVLIASP